jgi:hypothetical protein
MPKGRPSSRATSIRRRPNVAAIATLTGLTLLGLTAMVGISAAVAAFTDRYVGGLLLGAGLVAAAWAASAWLQRHRRRPAPSPGRSRTLDCRDARWSPRQSAMGTPHPPTEAQRRVRPCPGTRHT